MEVVDVVVDVVFGVVDGGAEVVEVVVSLSVVVNASLVVIFSLVVTVDDSVVVNARDVGRINKQIVTIVSDCRSAMMIQVMQPRGM